MDMGHPRVLLLVMGTFPLGDIAGPFRAVFVVCLPSDIPPDRGLHRTFVRSLIQGGRPKDL